MTLLYENTSYMITFTMSGTKDLMPKHFFLFLSLCVYLLIILLNLTLIVTIILEKSLHEPMYLFVCNLCLNELYGTTAFYPKFMYDMFSTSNVISYIGCTFQSFVIYTSFMCEYTTLVVMAYDRYVAICKPLEYHVIIGTQTVTKAILYSWAFPIIAGFPNVILTSQMPLCGSRIDKLYCDNWSIVKMSCTPNIANNIYGFVVICIFTAHAIFVMFSYQRLIVACRKSKDSKKKFMQTCVPHVLSLSNLTIALLFDTMFSRYGTNEFPEHLRNFVQVEVLVVPPLFNPLMYGLKLSEVRKRLFQRCKKPHKVK